MAESQQVIGYDEDDDDDEVHSAGSERASRNDDDRRAKIKLDEVAAYIKNDKYKNALAVLTSIQEKKSYTDPEVYEQTALAQTKEKLFVQAIKSLQLVVDKDTDKKKICSISSKAEYERNRKNLKSSNDI